MNPAGRKEKKELAREAEVGEKEKKVRIRMELMKTIFRRIRSEEDDEDPKIPDRFGVKLDESEVRSLDGSRRRSMEPEETMTV
jgi:hypothetical protein